MEKKDLNIKIFCSTTTKQEQEVIISRVRADHNKINIYSSDVRCNRRILKYYQNYIIQTYQNKDKEIVAFSIQIPVTLFKKTDFLPRFRGGCV